MSSLAKSSGWGVLQVKMMSVRNRKRAHLGGLWWGLVWGPVTTGDLLVLLLPYLVGGERIQGLSGSFLEGLGLESFDQSSNRGLREASWGPI